MAQTVGIGLMGLPEAFSKLKPNLVLQLVIGSKLWLPLFPHHI